MLQHGLGRVLDLLDHGAGVRAERRRQDHLDLRRFAADDDLADERQLHDVHAQLRVHHGAEGVQDGQLSGALLEVEGRSFLARRGVGRNRIAHNDRYPTSFIGIVESRSVVARRADIVAGDARPPPLAGPNSARTLVSAECNYQLRRAEIAADVRAPRRYIRA